MTSWGRACAAVLLAAAAWLQPVAAAAVPPASLAYRADQLVNLGNDWPDEAMAGLAALGAEATDTAGQRVLAVSRGLVAARAGRDADADAAAAALRGHGAGDPLAMAGGELVLAVQADTRGRFDVAAEHAQAAAELYASSCRAPGPSAVCEHRQWWRAHVVLYTRAISQGNRVAARGHMNDALEIAQAAGDLYLQAWNHATLASLSASLGEFDLARRQMAQAQRLARLEGSASVAVRMRLNEARIALSRDDAASARGALEGALPLARQARSPRLEALVLNNLSDEYVKSGRPRDALAAIERALPIVRRYGDLRLERALLHNAGLARIGLGRMAEGRRDLDRVIELWATGGGEGDRAVVLREFGDALAAAGDARGALELYHRERTLAAEIMAANRDSALLELRARYDREAQQRDIQMLARDNELKSARLANRALMQRVWFLVAAMLLLALVLVALLYRRVRETHRQLARSHAWLRVQSERDALTGLANRRRFQDVMRDRGAQEAFDGALLLVDVDHFKRVNDTRGHAAGDQVLVEISRRLNDAVRAGDMVVRWGGEEFLIYAPRVAADQVATLAERVLQAVGDTPVAVEGAEPLNITASIGYARFPLPPHRVSLSWEQAVNLADMALYTAKSLGRNRAVGIAGAKASHAAALREVESNFEGAWTDGRLDLQLTPGPA
jgi:diguanylate cyclase (GGDEF)-like protein